MVLCARVNPSLHLSSKLYLRQAKAQHLRGYALQQHCIRSEQRQRGTLIIAAAANPKIAVIGGGVIGLTSALNFQQRFPDSEVTIISEKLAVDTTSEGAGGLWKPFAISGTPPEKVTKWGKDTFNHYLDIYNSPDAPIAGVFLCPAYELYHEAVPDPDWKDVVPSFRHLTTSDLEVYDPTQSYSYGFAYDTMIAEGRLYMKWVLMKLQASGRTNFEMRRVESFSELSSYSAIINCTGLGARELASDPLVHAIRGHVLRVRAPWVKYHVEAAQKGNPLYPAYIIPNNGDVVLGGTKQVGDEDLMPREEEREGILARCAEVIPSLAAAEVVAEWVGLRPGRNAVRLELERKIGFPDVVHNYGHLRPSFPRMTPYRWKICTTTEILSNRHCKI